MLLPDGLTMLPEERRTQILLLLNERDVVRPPDLAQRLDVSLETIRRDFVALERAGAIRRMYGGATLARGISRPTEPTRSERARLESAAKEQIAGVVASLVSDRDTLFLDVGTTVEAAAHNLSGNFRGRIITNNISVVTTLVDRPQVDLHLLGGRVRHDEISCSGPDTESLLGQFYADKAFVGSGGVHPTAGLTDYHVGEIAVRHRMIANATQVYVLADASKIGHVALRRVCDLDKVSAIITDEDADPKQVSMLRDAGVTVLQGPVIGGDAEASDWDAGEH